MELSRPFNFNTTMIKTIYIILFGIALFLSIFCYWGLFTSSGRSNFDEMAGFIPFFAGLIAFFLYLIIFIIWVIRFFKQRNKKRNITDSQ